MGQVGVSFAVAPSDVSGYSRRFEDFLRKYNPKGLSLVPDVVRNHPEIETFTKMYKRFNVVDYPARVRAFFELYGPDYVPRVPDILAEWENREEELMRSLILDNGPELAHVDFNRRLMAFGEKYQITDGDLQRVVAGRDREEAMAELTQQYGPEPSPLAYCFPSTFYSGVSPSGLPPTPAGARPVAPPSAATRAESVGGGFSTMSGQQYSYDPHTSVPRTGSVAGGSGRYQQQSSFLPQTPANRGSSVMAATPTGPSGAMVELWSKLCEDLRQASVPLAELHYVNEGSFDALLVELSYPPHIRAQLTAEWTRRVRMALKQEQLSAGDATYEAARRDILTIADLHPLNVSVVGVTSVRNSEHEASFSLRLGDAKVRATERMLMVGDYNKLLNAAIYGIAPTPMRTNAAGIFFRHPLSMFQKATSVSVLVCDVVVGKPHVISDITSTPYEATPEFLRDYDSCIFTDPVQGQAVAVYSPQQVLPRYIVHCNVDNSITPCPANPNKPVEYLVVENNAFACSQCVVMGQYRGKEVIPIEEAATQARTQLSEMHRDATGLVKTLVDEEENCGKQLSSLARGEVQENALRLAEQIRREAEQRIQQIMLEAEEVVRTQQHSITQQKNAIHKVLTEAQSVANTLHSKITKSPTGAVEALLQLRNNSPVVPLREKVQATMQAARDAAAQVPASSLLPSNWEASRGPLSGAMSYVMPTRSNNADVGAAFGVTGSGNAAASVPRSSHQQSQPSFSSQPMQQSSQPSAAAFSQPRSGSNAPSVPQGDLFSKYMSLKGNMSRNPQQQQPPSDGGSNVNRSLSQSSQQLPSATRPPPSQAASSPQARFNKEQMTKGWSEFKKGDREAALRTWTSVYERNSNNGTGMRAKAYIAEALERDYEAAAGWYEKALRIDPADCMTLYNYGVLLESVLGRKREALDMFEAAHRHGDNTAGRRAQQLRTDLGLQ